MIFWKKSAKIRDFENKIATFLGMKKSAKSQLMKSAQGKIRDFFKKLGLFADFFHTALDDDTRRDLRRRKLCFTCQKPWASGHRCAVGKAHYIEVFSDNEGEEDAY